MDVARTVRWPRTPKVVVLGLDGLDYFLTQAWLSDGSLPNLAALADRGSFGRLETVNPAVSPVAWASFLTGSNPGKHGVLDFVTVDPRSLLPGPTASRRTKREGTGGWECLRQLPGFATQLTAAGASCAQILAPVSFPAAAGEGLVVCGMETPDRFGTQGSYRLLTTDPELLSTAGRHGQELTRAGTTYSTELSLIDGDPLRIEVTVDGDSVAVGGLTGSVRIEPGQWSQWFAVGDATDRTVVQAFCRSIDPVTVYLSAPQYAPESPLVTSDPSAAAAVVAECGPYPTLGYPYDTKALDDGVLTDREFLDHARMTADRLHDVVRCYAESIEADVFVAHFTEVDAIQHMFWRELDYGHPLHAESAPVRGVIKETYQRLDAVVGAFLAGLAPETAVIVVSDHGCHCYRFDFDLNKWLSDEGYLSQTPAAGVNAMYWGVDWSRTRAYSYGMGRIALNLEGRERFGQVKPGDQADALLSEISDRLRQVHMAEGAGPVVGQTWRARELYSGSHLAEAPDLTVGLQPGVRSCAISAVGGIADAVLAPNRKKWSGDHASLDPSMVPGVIFSSLPLNETTRRLIDVAPTVLDLMGCDLPGHADGTSLCSGSATRSRTGALMDT